MVGFGTKADMVGAMTKREHRELVASFVTLDEGLTRASEALSNGEIALVELELERAKQRVGTDAPALTVPEAAEELGVSRPTVRSWIAKGLLDVVADSSPRRVTFSSVRQLEERLGKLRALAKDERRFSQLLQEAADQRALAQPGAREGLQDALVGDVVDL
jgi:excisionase family DNA binding protein